MELCRVQISAKEDNQNVWMRQYRTEEHKRQEYVEAKKKTTRMCGCVNTVRKNINGKNM
jgi:hypothetical protein